MNSANSSSSVETTSLLKQDLRKTIMTESILFLVLGVTSYLSLIFMPHNILVFFVGAILYGAVLLVCGSVGLYGSYKVRVKVVLVYLILLVFSAVANSMAIVACVVLLIQHLVRGVPQCSQTCDLARFVFVTFVIYYVLQAVFALVLFAYSCISFKHSLLFYRKEKKFLVGFVSS
jgi:hypothetical protein